MTTIKLAENIKRFRLAVFCPREHDATSLYRAMGPLSAMERQDPRLELRLPRLREEGLGLDWSFLMGCDAVLVQRPWLPMHAQLLVQAKMVGLPTWVDWDDDYPAIHPSNPAYKNYAACGPLLDQVCKLADVISVSTPELSRRRATATKTEAKFRVIPNAWQFPMQPLDKPRARRVAWRGGTSHNHDLMQVLPGLVQVANDPKFGKWEFCFLGDIPWEVQAAMPAERMIGDFGAEPYLYMEALGRLLPFIHVVPLADNNKFNEAKSNLAWIEASCAGAVVVAPDLPEFRRPGIVSYHGRKEFAEVLGRVMKTFGEHDVHPGVTLSREYITEHLGLPKVNQQRWDIINQLANINAPRFFSQTV